MRGSFTPFVQLYDGFYFTPEHEPAEAQYNFEKAIAKDGFSKRFKGVPFTTFEKYCDWKLNHDPFRDHLHYEIIQIVEREPTPKIEGLAMKLPSELQKEVEVPSEEEAVELEEKPKRGRRKSVKMVTPPKTT